MRISNVFGLTVIIALVVVTVFVSCNKSDDSLTITGGTEDPQVDVNDSYTPVANPTSAFDEFDSNNVTITYSGDNVTISSNGLPNHTSPYWAETNVLHIDPVVADENQMSPGTINTGSYTLTADLAPALATTSSATGLGAVGIAVSGVPIFNDEEGPNIQLSENVASGFDYAGGHMGPTGYHYHLESQDVTANTTLSHDDDALVGIMEDGFLLYGRKCNSTATYPTNLDASGGHIHETQHGGGEIYHYHIINEYYVGSYITLFAQDLQGIPNGVQ